MTINKRLLPFLISLYLMAIINAGAQSPDYSKSLSNVKSGEELLTVLNQAKNAGINLDSLPAPPREALRNYFGEHLFYDFKPELFWPDYPENWRQGMRNVYSHALKQDYEYENRYHAIEHLDIFFSQDQISDYFLPEAMKRLSWNIDDPLTIGRNTSRVRREQMAFWLQSILSARNVENQIKVLKILGSNALKYAEIKDILDANPEIFIEMLRYGNAYEQQNWLRYHRPVPADHPEVYRVVLESLKDDEKLSNQREFSRHLYWNFDILKDKIRKSFLESREYQQKAILCDIIILKDDETVMPEILDFLWKSLADASKQNLILPRRELGVPGYYGEGYWWENEPRFPRKSRMRWASYRLNQMGDRAIDYLLSKTNQCVDAQQLAFCLFIIQINRQEHRIQWTDEMINLLMKGLENNSVEYDQGITALTIKRLKGSPKLLEGMKRKIENPEDEQQEASLSILIDYYTQPPNVFLEMRKKICRYAYLGYFYDKDWERYYRGDSQTTGKNSKVIYWEYYQMLPAFIPEK